MADSPSEVWEMISNLKGKSKTAAQTEMITLQVNISCYFITEWYCSVTTTTTATTTTTGEGGLANIRVTEQSDGT